MKIKVKRGSTSKSQPYTIRVWYVSPVGKIDQPVTFVKLPDITSLTKLLGPFAKAKKMLKEVCDEANATLLETDGVEGIAATDPYWNGKPTFLCGKCSTLHNVHQMVAENLYMQGRARN